MADNEPGTETPDLDFGGGALTQEALDALLEAADEESALAADPDALMLNSDAAAESSTEATPRERPGGPGPVVSLPSFDSANVRTFGSADGEAHSGGMTRVRDIPLEVTVELGRTRLLIRDILDLGAGSIIELDKLAGEPVDLFANGLLVARGEVVVIDDNFGVRVTEIITAADRKQTKETDALAA
jgi:flagellar motor switch protein FliN